MLGSRHPAGFPVKSKLIPRMLPAKSQHNLTGLQLGGSDIHQESPTGINTNPAYSQHAPSCLSMKQAQLGLIRIGKKNVPIES